LGIWKLTESLKFRTSRNTVLSRNSNLASDGGDLRQNGTITPQQEPKTVQKRSLVAGLTRSQKLQAGWTPITSHTWVQSLKIVKMPQSEYDVPKLSSTFAYLVDLSDYKPELQQGLKGNWKSMSSLIYNEVSRTASLMSGSI
jgi:hypothetical protein